MTALSKTVTIREKYGPAMGIIDQQEADEYFEICVLHCMRFGRTRERAERIERQNLGYYAGYYDAETMRRVNQLFGTTHPIFGDTQPTVEEAFEAGKHLAADVTQGGE